MVDTEIIRDKGDIFPYSLHMTEAQARDFTTQLKGTTLFQ